MRETFLNSDNRAPLTFATFMETSDQRRLRVVVFSKKHNRQKGTVIFLPGMGDCLERYTELFSNLLKRDFCYASLDWYGQGGSVPDVSGKGKNVRPTFDIYRHINDLAEVLQRIIYTDCPPPYYVLGYDMGCLIAISALDVINNQCSRFIGISPLFSPLGYNIGSFQDKISRIMKDFGLGRIKLRWGTHLSQIADLTTENAHETEKKQYQSHFAQPDRKFLADIFEAVKYANERLQKNDLRFPALFVRGYNDKLVSRQEILRFCDNVRLADTLTLFGAHHDIFHSDTRTKKQFWALFDTFIPGSNAYNIIH